MLRGGSSALQGVRTRVARSLQIDSIVNLFDSDSTGRARVRRAPHRPCPPAVSADISVRTGQNPKHDLRHTKSNQAPTALPGGRNCRIDSNPRDTARPCSNRAIDPIRGLIPEWGFVYPADSPTRGFEQVIEQRITLAPNNFRPSCNSHTPPNRTARKRLHNNLFQALCQHRSRDEAVSDSFSQLALITFRTRREHVALAVAPPDLL